VINMLYIKHFLEFASDADMAEIDLNQTFSRSLTERDALGSPHTNPESVVGSLPSEKVFLIDKNES